MAFTWVVVADSSQARIFRAKSSNAPLEELQSLSHPASRLPAREINTDRAGRSFSSAGAGRSAMSNEVEPKEHEAMLFAKEVVDCLEKARNEQRFDKVMMIAPPAFLGLLRERVSTALARMVSGELDKNLSQLDAREIRRHLPARL